MLTYKTDFLREGGNRSDESELSLNKARERFERTCGWTPITEIQVSLDSDSNALKQLSFKRIGATGLIDWITVTGPTVEIKALAEAVEEFARTRYERVFGSDPAPTRFYSRSTI